MVEQAATPTTLGRYELLVPIAQGGMAAVWAARLRGTRGFQKTVAVKCMLPALSEDPQFEEMFLAEAELASRIRHPNVCEILDLGEQEGTLYIVMEWVDGEPLSTIQKAARATGGVPMAIATRIVLNAAAGLHAAHELKTDTGDLVGLVHRDVSPQNILVTYDGVVKIVDFGVAKATAEADGGFTKAGQIKGKVPFIALQRLATPCSGSNPLPMRAVRAPREWPIKTTPWRPVGSGPSGGRAPSFSAVRTACTSARRSGTASAPGGGL